MRKSLFNSVLVATSLAVFPTAHADSSTTDSVRSNAAIMAAQTCAGCHGTEGHTTREALMPLAGMSQADFIRAMDGFADKTRPSTVMGSISRSLTKEEIKAMAAYFASFPAPDPLEKGVKS